MNDDEDEDDDEDNDEAVFHFCGTKKVLQFF